MYLSDFNWTRCQAIQADKAIKAVAVRIAFNVEQLDAFAFHHEQRLVLHAALPAATFMVLARCIMVCASAETKCYVHKWNQCRIADLNRFTDYSFHLNHIFELLKRTSKFSFYVTVLHRSTSTDVNYALAAFRFQSF